MNPSQQNNQQISVFNILSEAWVLFRENLGLFVGISVLGNILYTFTAFIYSNYFFYDTFGPPQKWTFIVAIWVSVFIHFWAMAALIIAASERYQGNALGLKEAFLKVEGRYVRFIIFGLLYTFIVGIGYLLLLVPGIYWTIIFILTPVVAVLGEKNQSPLKVSRELTQGFFGKVFLLALIFLVITLFFYFPPFFLELPTALATILSFFFSLICVPFILITEVALFFKLKEIKKSSLTRESDKKLKGGSTGMGCMVLFGLGIAMMILSGVAIRFIAPQRLKLSYEIVEEMTFPGGVRLKSPPGWTTIKKKDEKHKYALINPNNSKIKRIDVWTLPLSELNIPRSEISKGSPEIKQKILDETLGKAEFRQKIYEGYRYHGYSTGKYWTVYTIDKTKYRKHATVYHWKNWFLIRENYLLLLSYEYSYTSLRADYEHMQVAKEEHEIRKMLDAVYVPD